MEWEVGNGILSRVSRHGSPRAPINVVPRSASGTQEASFRPVEARCLPMKTAMEDAACGQSIFGVVSVARTDLQPLSTTLRGHYGVR